MLEAIINPKNPQKGAWKMFFIGVVYASLSLLLVHWFFTNDPILSKYAGMIVVTFCVMFTLPYMYFIIKRESEEDEQIEGFWGVWKAHSDALYAFMWLFLGFIIAFAFWYLVLQNQALFNAQIGTYCWINNPGGIDECIAEYTFENSAITGAATKQARFLSILGNNIYVMIFTLLFSLIFGAGAIFVLAWNASVIAAAMAIFSQYRIIEIPLATLRYMLHGGLEIAAYFVTALAGGIFGVGILRNGIRSKLFIRVFENTIILLVLALVILVAAAVVEVYITPIFFK